MSYAELHCKTNFSFLEGASHAHELIERAAELGYAALAVTDRHTLSGVVRAHAAAKEHGFKLIIGAEIIPVDHPPVVLWATDRASYGRLSRLITVGRRRALKGQCELTFDDLAQHAQGLLAGFVTYPAPAPIQQLASSVRGESDRQENIPFASINPRAGAATPAWPDRTSRQPARSPDSSAAVPTTATCIPIRQATAEPADSSPVAHIDRPISCFSGDTLGRFRDLFGDRGYLLAALHRGPDDRRDLQQLIERSRSSHIPLLATGNVLYHQPARRLLHDVLTAIRHGTTVAAAGDLLQPNAERHLHSCDELQMTFAAAPARYGARWR